MAKAPEDRYQNIAEFRDDLRRMLQDLSLAGETTLPGELSTSNPSHLTTAGPVTRAVRKLPLARTPPILRAGLAGLALMALVAIGIWFLFGSKSSGSVAADTVIVRLHGSNTIGAKLAPALAEDFFRHLGAKDVRTVPGDAPEQATVWATLPGESAPKAIAIESHGSATAFTDLASRSCDIGLSSRKIKPDEVQKLAPLGNMLSAESEHILALDGIAVIVNSNNPIDSLTKEQVANIFSGQTSNWTQVLSPRGHIKVYARDDKSGTYDSFKALVLGNNALVNTATRFEDSAALSDAVANDPDAIGFIGMPYVRNAKAVAISEGETTPLLPNRLTVATEDYVLSRRLYLYTMAAPRNRWVGQFVDFALSKSGQEVVAHNGLVALEVKTEALTIVKAAPEKYKNLTNGAERLSLNFRFHKGGKELDNKARLDLDRVVDFVTELKLTGQNLLLFGFADDAAGDDQNLALSKERATLVAEQFKRRGVMPAVIDGFGSWLPVASNATEEGKEKNRRVEIWLRK
jgi:phosphate transport system substrate-binding protein